MNDITAIYYTANRIPPTFANHVRNVIRSIGIPIISVSQKPIDFGINIVVDDFEPSHLNIYRQALMGAKEATTKYIALCEDDVIYNADHFTHRPAEDTFGYNLNCWNIFTWGAPVFHRKDGGRRNLYSLICERSLFIEAMEERFRKYPNEVDPGIFAEPSKYEKNLGVTVREWEPFYSDTPLVAFSHQTALSFANLGKKKRQGQVKATEIPTLGRAEDVIKLYI